MWEPVPCHFGNFGNLVETLLGNLVGTFAMETWLPWQPWKPSLENFYSGTVWEPLLGKLGNLYLEILGLCTWQLGILYLGTFWALQESVLGNLGDLHLGAFTRNCCGNLHSVTLATLGALWNLYLGTLREPLPWEPWRRVRTCTRQPLLGNVGNLHLGTFTR